MQFKWLKNQQQKNEWEKEVKTIHIALDSEDQFFEKILQPCIVVYYLAKHLQKASDRTHWGLNL